MLVARNALARFYFSRSSFLSQRSISTTSTPALIPAAFLQRARAIASEYEKLSSQLEGEYDVKIARKAGELAATAAVLREWEVANNGHAELQHILLDPHADSELRSLAAEEVDASTSTLVALSSRLKHTLVPAHPFAHLPCLLELRPGAGGSEASLFAGNLLRMYLAFCKRHRLRTSLLKLEDSDGMGSDREVQEAILEIEGESAYGLLRSEAGVHRVQRVPATEKTGRTHTSAVSVLVLPSFPTNPGDELGEGSANDPESDYYINPVDVRTDVMRARGAGGQHVNTTDSAVRLTHVPTGTVVAIQDTRSQHKNREKAWHILRSRIAQARRDAREEEMGKLRLSLVGVAKMGRGDKIRTYNWGQQRVTDHRTGITVHNLDEVLEGGSSLDEVMKSVRIWLTEQDLETLAVEQAAGSTS